MARVKRAVNAHKKRREILEQASGYRGQRSRLYRKAKEQVLHSEVYAFNDRRKRKGDFRRLWIQRINAGARANGITYNRLIQGLKLAGVEVEDLLVGRQVAEGGVDDVGRHALPHRVRADVGQAVAELALRERRAGGEERRRCGEKGSGRGAGEHAPEFITSWR